LINIKVKEITAINKQNIVLALVAGLLIWNLINTKGISTDIKQYKKQIELIETKVDSAKTIDKTITVKIDSVQQRVFGISKEIHYIDKNINIIKKQTDEKVSSTNKFSNAELEQFFSNRYNQSNNSN
jgi:chromosome segregation ATPase